MTDLSDATWSEVDASNNASPPNGWPEGMMPSGVNDAARADRGALKRHWNRATFQVSCSATPYQYNTANTAYPTAYVDGEVFCFKAGRASVNADSLAINGLSAKQLFKTSPSGPTAIAANDIIVNDDVIAVYHASYGGTGGGGFLVAPLGRAFHANALPVASLTATGTVSGANINTTGQYQIGGTLAMQVSGGYTRLYDPTSSPGGVLLLGASQNWHANDTHFFTNRSSSTTYGTLNSTGLTLTGSLTAAGITASSGSIIASNGQVHSEGTTNALVFDARDFAMSWFWYGSGGQAHLYCSGAGAGGADCFTFDGNNTTGTAYKPVAGPWSAISDRRIKEGIEDYLGGLAEVCRLRPVSYAFNGRGGRTRGGHHIGLIADEAELVMPEMVGSATVQLDPGDAELTRLKTLDPGPLTYALVNAVKQLASRVASLEAARA